MSLIPHGKQNTINHPGMRLNDTHRNSAKRLLKAINEDPSKRIDDQGITWITLKYKHCKTGDRLIASGHTRGSREYAEGSADPSNTVDRSDTSQVIDLGASTTIQDATLQGWVRYVQ